MTFTGAVTSCLRQYATFTGRATRAEYWWFYLFAFLVGVAAGAVDALLDSFGLEMLVNLALLLPSIAVTARRLHDSNLSAWWMLLAGVIPVAVGVVAIVAGLAVFFASAFTDADPSPTLVLGLNAFGGFVLLATGVLWLVLMLRGSTPGPNRFGAHPYAAPLAPPAGVQRGSYLPEPPQS